MNPDLMNPPPVTSQGETQPAFEAALQAGIPTYVTGTHSYIHLSELILRTYFHFVLMQSPRHSLFYPPQRPLWAERTRRCAKRASGDGFRPKKAG